MTQMTEICGRFTHDSHTVVRETAGWALTQLNGGILPVSPAS
jgi:hypothetical protein